jgi:hypothetical protein
MALGSGNGTKPAVEISTTANSKEMKKIIMITAIGILVDNIERISVFNHGS